MRKFVKLIIFSVIAGLMLPALTPLRADAAWNPPIKTSCGAIYLVNADTGTVMYEKNAQEKIYPASITKLMTAILVYEKYKDSMNTKVTVESGDITPLYGTYGSVVPLRVNEQFSIDQLLHLMLIRSGDDCANVLARVTAGSVDDFVEQMNQKAKEIGLKNTHYMNPHGLHDENHYTTAYDCYLLAKYAMQYDALAEIVASTNYTLDPTNKISSKRVFSTTNFTLMSSYKTYYYKYIKGIKTGTTTPAGACLVSYAERNGQTYYCVAMRGKKENNINTAFTDTKALYQWAFGNFDIKPIVKPTDTAAQVKLDLAVKKTKLLLNPQKQLNALVPDTFKPSDLKITMNVPDTVRAPVKKGQVIGTEEISLIDPSTKKEQKLGTVSLVASEDIERSQPLYVLSIIKHFFNSGWFKVVAAILLILLILYIILSIRINRRRRMINSRRRKKYTYRR